MSERCSFHWNATYNTRSCDHVEHEKELTSHKFFWEGLNKANTSFRWQVYTCRTRKASTMCILCTTTLRKKYCKIWMQLVEMWYPYTGNQKSKVHQSSFLRKLLQKTTVFTAKAHVLHVLCFCFLFCLKQHEPWRYTSCLVRVIWHPDKTWTRTNSKK